MNTEQLHKLFLQCNTVCTDTRKIKSNDMFFALKGDNFNGNTFADQALKDGAKYVIIDEAEYKTSEHTILVENVLKALQDLAAHHRTYLNIPIIALTGSNGKTTTKELINATLSQKFKTTATLGNLNNHIGVPLTLLSMNKDTEIGIVEMGANHLNEIETLCEIAQPDYGYITNFGKAHLEGFGSIEGVIKGKSELYNHLIANNKTIFINANDSIQVKNSSKARTLSFGDKNTTADITIDLLDTNTFVYTKYKNLEIKSQLIGAYNFNNISAAITIANYFKVEDIDIKAGIEKYTPTNNRSQIITKANTKIILDAYNANPSSMHAALQNFEKLEDKVRIAILGDMFELGTESKKEHQDIVDLISIMPLDEVILIGEHFYKTKIASQNIHAFKNFETFKTQFDFQSIKNSTLLIKGSRGMALERILELI